MACGRWVSFKNFLSGVFDARNSQERKGLREPRNYEGEFGEFYSLPSRERHGNKKRVIRSNRNKLTKLTDCS